MSSQFPPTETPNHLEVEQSQEVTATELPPYLPPQSEWCPQVDKSDLFEATPIGGFINEPTADHMSKVLLKHTCDFCKTKTFSNSNNLRRHYLTCRQIKILEQTAPHLVPQLIKDYKETAQQRLEEKRAQTRKRLLGESDGSETIPEEEFDPKAIRNALNRLQEGTVLAYYPCPKCCLPLKSVEKLANHLLNIHQYLIDEQNE